MVPKTGLAFIVGLRGRKSSERKLVVKEPEKENRDQSREN